MQALNLVYRTRVPAGRVGVFGMGQAGFILKGADGFLLALDLYLSDICERAFGFRRLVPAPFLPGEASFDLVVASHAHFDHFDADSMPWLLRDAPLVCGRDCLAECQRLGLPLERVTPLGVGERTEEGDWAIEAVPCDHGELAPQAVGLLLTIAGKRIYYMGDTAYRPDLLENPRLQAPDALLLPINGAFGNLNEEQAAQVVAKLRPGLAIPCHYGMFAAHGGAPQRFLAALEEAAPGVPCELLPIGRYALI